MALFGGSDIALTRLPCGAAGGRLDLTWAEQPLAVSAPFKLSQCSRERSQVGHRSPGRHQDSVLPPANSIWVQPRRTGL